MGRRTPGQEEVQPAAGMTCSAHRSLRVAVDDDTKNGDDDGDDDVDGFNKTTWIMSPTHSRAWSFAELPFLA